MFPIETVLPTVFIFYVSSTKYYVGIFIFASWIKSLICTYVVLGEVFEYLMQLGKYVLEMAFFK